MIGWFIALGALVFGRYVLAQTKAEKECGNVFLGLYCVGSVVLALIP